MRKNYKSIKEQPNHKHNPFIYDNTFKEKEKYLKIDNLENNKGIDMVLAKAIKEAIHEYVQIGDGDLTYLLNSNRKTIALFIYICKNLTYNSDKIILDYKYIPNILRVSTVTFYQCVINLIELNIIANSNIDCIFYINSLKMLMLILELD